MYFGLMTSLNGLIVIIGTPILTKCASSLSDTAKLLTGQLLVCTALSMYIFIQGIIPMYYISMILFTLGEIITTLGSYPYLTRRIPASHRGRISSLVHIFCSSHVRIPMENSLHPAGPNHHNRLEIYNRSRNSGSNPLPHTDKNRPKNIPTALPSKSIKNQLKPYQYYRAVPPSIVALRSRREAAYSINFQPHFSINCYNARKTKIQSGGQP